MSELNISGMRLLPSAALAGVIDVEAAKQHFQKGKAFYDSGEYEKALLEFMFSFKLSKKPELQYNLALCYEKLLRIEEALGAYKLYLRAMPNASDRNYVEERIAFLTAQIEEQRRPQIVVATDAKPRPFNYRPLMWTSLALSVIGLTVGGIYSYKAGDKEDEYSDLVDRLRADGMITGGSGSNVRFRDEKSEQFYADELNDSGEDMKRFDRYATIGFISGVALVAGGGLFYWLDRGQSVRLRVETQASSGTLNLGWQF